MAKPRGTESSAGRAITGSRSAQRAAHEAVALAARVAAEQPAALYSSDLPRAARRRRRSRRATGLEPVFDARWREVDVGEWLGFTPEEVQERYPDGYARWLAGGTGWREGETYPEMAERALAAAREVADRHAGASEPVVCVTHGGVIRAILMDVVGMPPASRRLLATGPTATITAIDARAPDLAPRAPTTTPGTYPDRSLPGVAQAVRRPVALGCIAAARAMQ